MTLVTCWKEITMLERLKEFIGNSFSPRVGHEPILESTEEEEVYFTWKKAVSCFTTHPALLQQQEGKLRVNIYLKESSQHFVHLMKLQKCPVPHYSVSTNICLYIRCRPNYLLFGIRINPMLICRENIVTWRPKDGIVKSESTFIARQRLGKHVPAATNMQATIE
jgi:hypothetical protein